MTARRGVILVVVLWVVAVLAVVCLALGGTIGFKQAQVRRCRQSQADQQALFSALAAARRAVLDDPQAADTLADAWTGDEETFTLRAGPAEARLFVPDADGGWGLQDESGLLNANTATSEMLARLPGMTPAAAERFVALRDAPGAGEPAGLTGPIATLGQLAATLVKAFGEAGAGELVETGAPRGGRTWWAAPMRLPDGVARALRLLTVHSRQRNVDARGRPRVHLNAAPEAELAAVLGESLTAEQVQAVLEARRVRPFRTIGELLVRPMVVRDAEGRERTVRIDKERFQPLADRLTVRSEAVLAGLVNVNTAPAEVLAALPGLTAPDVEAIVAARGGAGAEEPAASGIGWLLDVIGEGAFAEVCPFVTVRSQQFRFHAAVGPAAAGGAYAMGVLERDGRQCRLLCWRTWRAWAGGE